MPPAYDPSAARSGSTFSDNPNYNAVWVCYVDGIETPILGFNVSSGVWQPPRFEIYTHPDVSMQRLGHEDRVPVQIFYMDYWNVVDKPELRLLVDGEIRGYRSKKAMGQRVMSFTCMSHISVFEKLYFFFMNTVDDIVAAQSPEIRSQGFTGQGLFYPYSLFHQGLFVNQGAGTDAEVRNEIAEGEVPAQGDVVKTAHEIHYNIIKGIIGCPPAVPGLTDDKRSLPMMNFFARHTRKTRLHQRFVRLPILEDVAVVEDRKGVFPIFAAVRADEALMAMQHQVAGRIGNSGSIWEMLKQIYGLVYMEMAMVPNPAAVHTNLEGEIIGPVSANDPLIEQIPPTNSGTPGNAPPSAAMNSAVQELRDAEIANERANIAVDEWGAGVFANLPGTGSNGRLNQLRAAANTARQRVDRAQRALNELRQPGLGPAIAHTDPTYGASVSSAAEVQPGRSTRGPIGSDPARPIRLAQYFAKPQFLFGIPPHCNVFFPSMIDDLSYGEEYEDQPTRVYVNDSVMGNLLRSSAPNREFMLHALTVAYPEEADAVMHANTPDSGHQTGELHRTGKNLLIWPEEFFKGPVTAKIELPSWFQTMMQFLNASEGGASDGVGGGNPASGGTATGGTVTPATLTSPSPLITIPQRGRDDSRVYLPDSWVLPPNVIAAGDAHHGIDYNYGEVVLTPGQTIDPYPAIIALVEHIQRIFPGHIRSTGFRRGGRSSSGGSRLNGSRMDLHQYGRACDLMIPMRGRAVDHVKGDPVANWLVQNAAAFGIQFMVWATTSWNSSRGRGRKHGPYGRPNQGSSELHRDHIHFEINLKAAHGQLGGYARLGVPATTAPGTLREPSARTNPTAVPVLTEPDLNISPPTPRAPTRTVSRTTAGAAGSPGSTAAGGTANRGPSDTAPTASSTTSTADTNNEGAELPANEKFANLFRLYAQYEYARQRYMQKNGAIEMRFNPFAVAGFPCVAFDRPTTSEHVVGYVYTVNHAAFAKSIKTSVQMTCVRTFPEFLNDVRNDCERFSERITAAPAEMIPEVRRIIQNEDQAELFYQRLFYGGPRPGNLPASFHFDRAIGYSRGLDVEEISIEGSQTITPGTVVPGSEESPGVVSSREVLQQARADEAAANALAEEGLFDGALVRSAENTARLNAARTRARQRREQAERDLATARSLSPTGDIPASSSSATTTRNVTHNLDPNEALTPLPNTIYTDAFDNYHIAMQLAARNVCTLTEYIRFWHGGRTLGDLISSGDVEGPEDENAYGSIIEPDVIAQGQGTDGRREVTVGQATRYTGIFYKRIFRLRQGPGRPPSEAERGYTEGATPSGTTAGVPADYPQTRADWDSILLAYRQQARTRLSPST